MDPQDPTRMLREIREALAKYNSPNSWDDDRNAANAIYAFEQLDQHMSKGGLLPLQWAAGSGIGRPRRDGDGPVVLDGVSHGTRHTYNMGCRCLACTKANRDAGARTRAARRGARDAQS